MQLLFPARICYLLFLVHLANLFLFFLKITFRDNSQPTLFFVGQILEQVFAESDDENINDNASEDAEAKDDHLSKEGPDDAKPMLNLNKTSSSADDQVVKSSETGKDPDEEKDKTSNSVISEDMIKEAIEKRAFYFRKNSEYVFSTTIVVVRLS